MELRSHAAAVIGMPLRLRPNQRIKLTRTRLSYPESEWRAAYALQR